MLIDIAAIITSLATLVASVVAAVIALRASKQLEVIHIATNSMKDALVKSVGEQQRAEGVIEGAKEERANPTGPVTIP